MIYSLTKICPGKWDTKNSQGFWGKNWSDIVLVNKKKSTCQLADFIVLADPSLKTKESKKTW